MSVEKEQIKDSTNPLDNYNLVEESFKDSSRMLRAYNEQNKVVGQYLISPVKNTPVRDIFNPELIDSIGDTIYEGRVDSKKNGIGLGLELWKLGELKFQRERETTIRLITDISRTGWTEKKLPLVLEYLERNGVEADLIKSTEYQNIKYWLFLFSNSRFN